MKGLSLENGKARLVKNAYDIEVKIGRKNDNYFIIHDSKSRGPFEKIFLNKTDIGNVIIGYNKEESKFYTINKDGLKLIKKEQLNIEKTPNINENIEFDNCKLVVKFNELFVFVDNSSGKLFIVNSKQKIKDLSDYPKFTTYDDLLNYCKDQFKISINTMQTRSLISKEAHLLIKFKDLYSSAINLSLDHLPDEILFDILTDRIVMKKIFDLQKKELFVHVYGDQKVAELIEDGYTTLKVSTLDTLLRNYPEQMKPYFDLLQTKIEELKRNCLTHIKKTDNIDFYKLESFLYNLSIKDLPRSSIAEITANRPLTRGIFMSMICACFDKLEKEGNSIKQHYRVTNNFKVTYPHEYSILWDIACKRLPDLSKEYFDERKKLFMH